MKYVKGFGVQWNLQTAVATLAPKGPVMQTEHRCGNYNFDTPVLGPEPVQLEQAARTIISMARRAGSSSGIGSSRG